MITEHLKHIAALSLSNWINAEFQERYQANDPAYALKKSKEIIAILTVEIEKAGVKDD